MSAPAEDLAAVLEQCRAHRAGLTRHLALAPDSLHRVLRCTRCGQWNLDTRVYEGFLQLADGGRRPCWSLDELLAFVGAQHLALHAADRLDPCRCGAPALALALVAARFLHAMPGSGAELVVDLLYEGDRASDPSLGRAVLGGPVLGIDEASEEAIHAAFGVPLTVWAAWRKVIAADQGGIISLEEGLALAAFPAAAGGLRAELDEGLRAEPRLRAYGLSARVTADPSWAWLRADPGLVARPDTVLVMMLRHDVLAGRLAALAAARGVDARRDDDTVWFEEAGVRWPVELPTVAEEGLRRGFTLSAMAAAATAHALDRLETLKTFLGAVEKLRPGVALAVEGMTLTASVDGVAGRPMDLRVAPFGPIPDPATLDRDLRFHLNEAPAWSDPWRVCPCGAARSTALHRWRRDDLPALGPRVADLALAPGEGDADGETVRVFALACDRHVEYALGPLLAARPLAPGALAAQAALDLDRQRFVLKVAPHVDASGRTAALVESAQLLDATAHPALLAGLATAVLGEGVAATVTTLSRELAVVAAEGVDPVLTARLEDAGRVLWTLQRGVAPTAVRLARSVAAGDAAAGTFERTA